MLFVKVNNYWYEYDPSTPIDNATIWNSYGGRSSNMNLTGLQIVEAENYSELDWRGTEVFDDRYITGWLDKDGNFYGCHYRNHRDQAKFVHGLSEDEIEKNQFIKISYQDRMRTKLLARVPYRDGKHNEITSRQYLFLKRYPIENFDEVDYIYRKQLDEKAKEELKNQSKNDKPENSSAPEL